LAEVMMRGTDRRSGELFSYVDLEQRVRADHPLRTIREVVSTALAARPADGRSDYLRRARGRKELGKGRTETDGAVKQRAFRAVATGRCGRGGCAGMGGPVPIRFARQQRNLEENRQPAVH
jgi:hypothetical protein